MSHTSVTPAHPADRWDVLTRTGPGTPAGELLRRYWQPIALSKDHGPGSPPEPIRLLGEDLVLFRDDHAELGLLARRCPHRGADLSYGRLEDGGLRCAYHGWLFDRAGTCLEMPNVPAESRGEVKWRQPAYPVRERGGIIWAYLGPGEPPVLPYYPFFDLPEEHVFRNRWLSECNYLQANEGNIDPSHTSFVHRMSIPGSGLAMQGFKADATPRLSTADTSYGFRLLAVRDFDDDNVFIRCSNFILPNAAAANGGESRLGLGGASMLWHVPIDDYTHYRWEIMFHVTEPIPVAKFDAMFAGELDEKGRRIRRLDNRFLQDRAEMAGETFAGVGRSFPVHDLMVTESMGPVEDRRNEHLTASDLGVMRARRLLLEAVEDVAAGKEPRGTWREEGAAAFSDFVTYTDLAPKGTDPLAHAEQMVTRGIYRPQAG